MSGTVLLFIDVSMLLTPSCSSFHDWNSFLLANYLNFLNWQMTRMSTRRLKGATAYLGSCLEMLMARVILMLIISTR